jgi:hypothetical protein
MDLIAAIAALTLGCFAYIFWPERNPFVQADKTRVDYLRERKDAIYENLRDLNFEYQAGKYPEADYNEQRTGAGRRGRAGDRRDGGADGARHEEHPRQGVGLRNTIYFLQNSHEETSAFPVPPKRRSTAKESRNSSLAEEGDICGLMKR